MELLLLNKANVNARDINDDTVLMKSCKAHKTKVANIPEILIQHGVDLNAKNKTGQTALMIG